MICEGVPKPWPEAIKMEQMPPNTQFWGGTCKSHALQDQREAAELGELEKPLTMGGCVRPSLDCVWESMGVATESGPW